jgi:hypothetical protein
MMEEVRTSETSVYSETTRRYIPEVSNLHTRLRENLKTHVNLKPVEMLSLLFSSGVNHYSGRSGHSQSVRFKINLREHVLPVSELGSQKSYRVI